MLAISRTFLICHLLSSCKGLSKELYSAPHQMGIKQHQDVTALDSVADGSIVYDRGQELQNQSRSTHTAWCHSNQTYTTDIEGTPCMMLHATWHCLVDMLFSDSPIARNGHAPSNVWRNGMPQLSCECILAHTTRIVCPMGFDQTLFTR